MTSLLRSRLTRTATFVFRVALLTIATGSLAYAQFQPYGESAPDSLPTPKSTTELVFIRLLPILASGLLGLCHRRIFLSRTTPRPALPELGARGGCLYICAVRQNDGCRVYELRRRGCHLLHRAEHRH